MHCINDIDWELFHAQKQTLLGLRDNPKTTQEECDVLDGVVNLMDAIQDEYEPADIDEDNSCQICGADGGTSCGGVNCGY